MVYHRFYTQHLYVRWTQSFPDGYVVQFRRWNFFNVDCEILNTIIRTRRVHSSDVLQNIAKSETSNYFSETEAKIITSHLHLFLLQPLIFPVACNCLVCGTKKHWPGLWTKNGTYGQRNCAGCNSQAERNTRTLCLREVDEDDAALCWRGWRSKRFSSLPLRQYICFT